MRTDCIFVCWGSNSKYHGRGGLHNRHSDLMVLEAASPRSGYQHGQAPVRVSRWLAEGCLLAVASHGRQMVSKLIGVSFKGTNFFKSLTLTSPPEPGHPPKAPISKYHPTGFRAATCEF